MASNELVKQSKATLAAALHRARAQASRLDAQRSSGQDVIARAFGSALLGPSTALVTGLTEGKFRNRDGSYLSLGPVPLSVLVSGMAQLAGVFFPDAARPLSYVTAANLGLAAGTLGREYGSKKPQTQKPQPTVAGDYGPHDPRYAALDYGVHAQGEPPHTLQVAGLHDAESYDPGHDPLESESAWTPEELELMQG